MKMEWNNSPFLLYDIVIFYSTPQYSTSGWTLVAAPSRACGQSQAFSCLGVTKLILLVELCKSLSYFLLFVAVKWCWCEVVQTLMRTLIVIILHVISNSRTEFTNVFRRVEIYVLLLDAAPEAFYPYIVFTTTSTIHAYLYAIAGQQILPVLGRILASLVSIHY